MNPTRRVIGIDFGSTQSSIAVMEIGSSCKPDLLNVGGGLLGQTVPTILALDKNDDTLIASGNEVHLYYKQIENSSVRFVSDFKRYLGNGKQANNDSPEIVDARKHASQYTKLFLSEMAKIVEKYFGLNSGELNSDEFVTCVAYPASWTDDQINLLKDLVKEAGFPADNFEGIYSLSEPEAVVHALLVNEGINFKFSTKPEHYLVIDFGGGTLDVCVIQTGILGMTPKIISTAGIPELGGKDFDNIIEKIFFKQNINKITYDDLSECEKFELHDRIREAKEVASEHFWQGQDSYKHSILLPSGNFELSLSKSEFLENVRECKYYEKIQQCLCDAIEHGGINPTQIKKVILTGGSSRWFFIHEIVKKGFLLDKQWILSTDTPFTDVATGCAVSIGLAKQGPEKGGIWVKFRLSDKSDWSEAKCLLPPGQKNKLLQPGVQFGGTIPKTHYFHPWRIHFSWWYGFEKDRLEPIGEEAAIDVFARSNYPFLSRIRNAIDAFRGKATSKLIDEYKVFLHFKEDAPGVCSYWFEIVDCKASKYTQKVMTDGLNNAEGLPKGWRCSGKIMPGFLSYQGLLGLRARKLIEWAPPVKKQTPTPKKKFYWPWE